MKTSLDLCNYYSTKKSRKKSKKSRNITDVVLHTYVRAAQLIVSIDSIIIIIQIIKFNRTSIPK